MRDLFFGLNVQPIGVIPYRSTTEAAFREGRSLSTSISLSAKRLRLPVNENARVYALPIIGSHVGADAAACLLATGMGEGDEICAMLDIGTNTEVLLGNRHRLLGARELTHADPRGHDAQAVRRVIEAEQMTDLVHRHGAHRFFVQLFALMVVHGERNVRVGDHPVVVTRPTSASADRLIEMIDPVDVHFRGGGVLDEREANREVQRAPFLERVAHAGDVVRRVVLHRRARLDPDGQRLPVPVRPSRE